MLEGKLMHRKTKRQITESKHVQAQQIHRHRTAGTFFFSLLADAEHGSSHLAGKKIFFICHVHNSPVHSQRSSLRCQGSHFGTQARRPYLFFSAKILLWDSGAIVHLHAVRVAAFHCHNRHRSAPENYRKIWVLGFLCIDICL